MHAEPAITAFHKNIKSFKTFNYFRIINSSKKNLIIMGKIKSAHYYEKQALELGKHEIRESAKCIRGSALRYLEADAFEILLGKKPVQRYLEKAKIQLFKFSDTRLCALSFWIHDCLENNQDSIKETAKKIIPNLVLTLYSVECADGIVNGGKCHWTEK